MRIFTSLIHTTVPNKSELTRLKRRIDLALLATMLIGCAGAGKMQPASRSTSETPAEKIQQVAAETNPTTAQQNNTAHGNRLSEWLDRTPASMLPAAGEDCAMIYDPAQHRIVLFGGKDDENENLSGMWALDLAKNIWQKITVAGESPPASEDHAMIYDPLGHRMILHGGEDGFTTNKIWAFDLNAQRWRNMTDSTGPAREDHTAIFDSFGMRMIIFGGRNNSAHYDDTNIYEIWALDLHPASRTFEKWRNLTVENNHAPGRSDHVAVYDEKKNRMIIYGGWDKDQKELFGDTWAFNFPALPYAPGKWKQIKTRKSHPPKRRHAASVYDASRNWFIVFGGLGEEGYLNDVWAFELDADVWINITPGPQPRLDHQAIYDPRSQRMLIYGGDARLKGKFHDIWELQIQPNLPLDLLLKEAGAQPQEAAKP